IPAASLSLRPGIIAGDRLMRAAFLCPPFFAERLATFAHPGRIVISAAGDYCWRSPDAGSLSLPAVFC
ncbi:hypothetical protein CKF46_37485, partial [Klebsiella pneumoniae]